jgi:hypothetical protein
VVPEEQKKIKGEGILADNSRCLAFKSNKVNELNVLGFYLDTPEGQP